MKHTYFFGFLFMCILSLATSAQDLDYGLATSTSTYVPLTGATSVNGTTVWDEDDWTINIGFTFNFYGQPFTEVTISDDYVYFDASGDYSIVVVGADMEDRGDVTSASPISYKLEGTAGNQILKIEWKNAGFYNGSSTDSISYQLWLHEGSDDVKVLYGPSQIDDIGAAFADETGAYISLIDLINNKYHHLEGDPANPTINPEFSLILLTGVPADGTVYLFGDPLLGIENNSLNKGLNIYPNPFKDNLFIASGASKTANTQMQLFDITGKKVMDISATQLSKGTMKVDLGELNSGVYFLQLSNATETVTRRVVKQ